MANYNTFVAVDCGRRKILLVTSSARKADSMLRTGIRIEVWNDNKLLERIYESDKKREPRPLQPYIDMEREFIKKKQHKAELRNRRRKDAH